MSTVAHADTSKLGPVLDRDYWLQLNPGLHISEQPFDEAAAQFRVTPPRMDHPLRQIVREGYTQFPPLVPRVETRLLAEAATRIFDLGLPPVFGFVYDEFWQLFANLSDVFDPLVGPGFTMKPADIWIWYVDREKAGWPPHRDMISGKTLHEDGRPANLTVWIPLTDVTPLNGCMYVLPMHLDPHVPRWMWRFGVSRKNLPNVRALPAEAGSVLCWNSRLLHWGSRSSEWADQPRISVGVYLQSRDYATSGKGGDFASSDSLSLTAGTPFPFKRRLDAIRSAIGMYSHRVVHEYPQIANELLAFAGVPSPAGSFRWPFLKALLGGSR